VLWTIRGGGGEQHSKMSALYLYGLGGPDGIKGAIKDGRPSMKFSKGESWKLMMRVG